MTQISYDSRSEVLPGTFLELQEAHTMVELYMYYITYQIHVHVCCSEESDESNGYPDNCGTHHKRSRTYSQTESFPPFMS